ncbi:MAG: hypothetical protein JSV78_14280 [Phycisphaerales bacterium]|nr:MAG: hypothetical protein JSV78_14280 [Phycisphaerales bacterium]
MLLPVCWIARRPSGRETPVALARVGQAQISGDDVSYRVAVEKAYRNVWVTDSVALVALINDALEHDVARRWKGDGTPDEVAALSKHVDETKRAPEIYKDVVEDDRCFMVIRLVQRNENQYTVDAVTVGKQSFDAWFREQVAKIELAILDSESRNTILSEHPNVGWVRRWPAQPKTGDK